MQQASARLVETPATELWRMPRVRLAVPMSASRIYRLVREGRFPKPIKLTPKTSAWDAGEIREWVEARRAERG